MTYDVLFLDDNEELRQIFPELIESNLNIRCLACKSLSEVEENLFLLHYCKIAILDIDLGFKKPSGIDAYYWLKEKEYKGKIVFLTGHGKFHPFSKQAQNLEIPILDKPISSELLLRLIRESYHDEHQETTQ